MKIVFVSENELVITRAYKSFDFSSRETRLNFESSQAVDIEELASEDFSSVTLVRDGMTNVTFSGYEVTDIAENYTAKGVEISISLLKRS